MAKHTALIPQIRKAEARLKALNILLERVTGVTEDQGLLLHQISTMGWTSTSAVAKHPTIWTNRERLRLAHDRLKRKRLIDVKVDYHRFRISPWGREVLESFKTHLKD